MVDVYSSGVRMNLSGCGYIKWYFRTDTETLTGALLQLDRWNLSSSPARLALEL